MIGKVITTLLLLPIALGLIMLVIMLVILISVAMVQPYHYEYVGEDGGTYSAAYCHTPLFSSQAQCTLADGTVVMVVKSYKRVREEN